MTSWMDLEAIPIDLRTPDTGRHQAESLARVHALIDGLGVPPGASSSAASRRAARSRSRSRSRARARSRAARCSRAGRSSTRSSAPRRPRRRRGRATEPLACHGGADPTVLPECAPRRAGCSARPGCPRRGQAPRVPRHGPLSCPAEERDLAAFLAASSRRRAVPEPPPPPAPPCAGPPVRHRALEHNPASRSQLAIHVRRFGSSARGARDARAARRLRIRPLAPRAPPSAAPSSAPSRPLPRNPPRRRFPFSPAARPRLLPRRAPPLRSLSRLLGDARDGDDLFVARRCRSRAARSRAAPSTTRPSSSRPRRGCRSTCTGRCPRPTRRACGTTRGSSA